jgi:hypothetical protein
METRDRAPIVAWVVLSLLAAASVLAVTAASVSGGLALAVILSGVVIALLLAWAAHPTPDSSQAPARLTRGEPHDTAV